MCLLYSYICHISYICLILSAMNALDIQNKHHYYVSGQGLCRIKLLPVTHVLVDTWMLTVKPVYKLKKLFYDLKWATNTHMTPFTPTFKAYITISMVLEDLLCSFIFFYPSTHISARPSSFLSVHMMAGRVST